MLLALQLAPRPIGRIKDWARRRVMGKSWLKAEGYARYGRLSRKLGDECEGDCIGGGKRPGNILVTILDKMEGGNKDRKTRRSRRTRRRMRGTDALRRRGNRTNGREMWRQRRRKRSMRRRGPSVSKKKRILRLGYTFCRLEYIESSLFILYVPQSFQQLPCNSLSHGRFASCSSPPGPPLLTNRYLDCKLASTLIRMPSNPVDYV